MPITCRMSRSFSSPIFGCPPSTRSRGRKFFYDTPNRLADWVEAADASLAKCLRLIAVQDFHAGCHLNLVMDDDEGRAVGYLESERP